jgi:hypothetical protein
MIFRLANTLNPLPVPVIGFASQIILAEISQSEYSRFLQDNGFGQDLHRLHVSQSGKHLPECSLLLQPIS